MKEKMIVLLCATLTFGFAASANDQETYCGSGLTKILVPDNFLGCKFATACKEHDECYGICDEGGSRYGSDYCKLSETSDARVLAKNTCDKDFEEKINLINQDTFRCRKMAALYRAVVEFAGQGPFNGKEAQDLILKIVDTSESEIEITEKVKLIGDLSKNHFIDVLSADLSQKDLITMEVKKDLQIPNIIQDNKLILKKGIDIKALQNLKIDQ